MEKINLDLILANLRASLEHNQVDAAIHLLESLRVPDRADLFSELDEKDQATLLPNLKPASSADILEELEDQEAAKLVRSLPTATAIRIVTEMEPDEAADLLGSIQPLQAETILAGLDDPDEVRPLLLHPEDTAGGLMTSEFLALRRRMTTTEALKAIHEWKPEIETIYYLFVVDRYEKLCGVVNLRQLIVSEPSTLMLDIMDPDVISVQAGTDQEEVARIMSRYDLVTLPVVNTNNVLLGVITIDDVIEVIEDEATEDIQRLGGAEPLELPYLDTSSLGVVRKRIGWLLLLFLTESLTGTVLRYFEDELQAVVALSFFIPLLIGTGGNAGSQTTSTLIRALAVGDIDLGDALRALWHELRVGLMLGFGMGIVAYGRALLWGTDAHLAITIALAIFTIVVWANGLGAVLPLFAARMKIDPTVVSGPVMSTLVDATGLFIYFTIARAIIGL
ncbi:MAG: magnesium transporter [Anaerolineales bacterium]|nr:MAG: magnesium transporter [Anaerolineales bacterium]